MEKVVYILGAGFSAPLGIPVVSNFLSRAKDLYFKQPERYGHFKSVFARIDHLAKLKNIFAADLSNIEEIISILDMDADFGGGVEREHFTQLVTDVVKAYTPAIEHKPLASNWGPFLFGQPGPPEKDPRAYYGYFAMDLCGVQIAPISSRPNPQDFCMHRFDPPVDYSVVSLNYDLVLENAWDFARQHYQPVSGVLGFKRAEAYPGCVLAKLHGSVDRGDIIAPTSRKTVTESLRWDWTAAFQVLSDANHIRVIGYSLPATDTYIRYFLKAALARTQHLKTFDVICLDPGGVVKARYEEFVEFSGLHFMNADVRRYLSEIHNQATQRDIHTGGTLELAHGWFVRANT